MQKTAKPLPKAMLFEKIWLTTAEAGKYLGVSRRFLDELRNNARITYYKLNHTIFFEKRDLDNLIRKNLFIKIN